MPWPSSVVAVPPAGCGISRPGAQGVPALAVLGEVDRLGEVPSTRPAGKRPDELERRLPTEAHDDARQLAGLLGLDDVGASSR